MSHFQTWEELHLEHKFPKADPILLERLARANCRRRQQFKYLEKHHYKLALGIGTFFSQENTPKPNKDGERNESDKKLVEKGPKSVASSMPATAVTRNTQTTVATFREVEQENDPDVEETLSETSSAASEGMSEGRDLPIPAPPKSALGGELFECPYCFEMIRISSLLIWR